MNIFVLDEDPEKAAEMMCDKHICSQILESGQLLCSAHEPGNAPWKRTHFNHPCAVWVRQTTTNYAWLCRHGAALCNEYTKRYEKIHAGQRIIEWCNQNLPTSIPEGPLTSFAVAIKDTSLHGSNAIESYRNYYLRDKARFAKWKRTNPPEWWIEKQGATQNFSGK